MRFRTRLLQAEGMLATGIVVPDNVIEKLGAGKRPPVVVTINGHSYRSTIAVMGGKFLLGVSAEHRSRAGLKAGDALDVNLELDTAPREVNTPADLAAALKRAKATSAFEQLAYSHRKEHVRSVEEAKSPETRQRRIGKIVEKVLSRKR